MLINCISSNGIECIESTQSTRNSGKKAIKRQTLGNCGVRQAMRKEQVLSEPVLDLEKRIRAIESEQLPDNISALLDAAANEAPERLAWHFFESGESVTY